MRLKTIHVVSEGFLGDIIQGAILTGKAMLSKHSKSLSTIPNAQSLIDKAQSEPENLLNNTKSGWWVSAYEAITKKWPNKIDEIDKAWEIAIDKVSEESSGWRKYVERATKDQDQTPKADSTTEEMVKAFTDAFTGKNGRRKLFSIINSSNIDKFAEIAKLYDKIGSMLTKFGKLDSGPNRANDPEPKKQERTEKPKAKAKSERTTATRSPANLPLKVKPKKTNESIGDRVIVESSFLDLFNPDARDQVRRTALIKSFNTWVATNFISILSKLLGDNIQSSDDLEIDGDTKASDENKKEIAEMIKKLNGQKATKLNTTVKLPYKSMQVSFIPDNILRFWAFGGHSLSDLSRNVNIKNKSGMMVNASPEVTLWVVEMSKDILKRMTSSNDYESTYRLAD